MWFDKLKKLNEINIVLKEKKDLPDQEFAVFGGGCFWCTEAVFKMLRGVRSITPGYSGGKYENPTYEVVSSGATTHAEVVRIEFNPREISYHDLLTVFFGSHDPTTPGRQGNDVGEQYRSIILTTTESQQSEAEEFIKNLNASHEKGEPIVTEVKPLDKFYEAEDYHKDYFAKNPNEGYCQLVINPKLDKVKKQYAELLKDESKLK